MLCLKNVFVSNIQDDVSLSTTPSLLLHVLIPPTSLVDKHSSLNIHLTDFNSIFRNFSTEIKIMGISLTIRNRFF